MTPQMDERAIARTILGTVWLLGVAGLLGCSSPSEEQATTCDQGPALACVGEGNCEGTQYCENGVYGVCQCNATGMGGSTGGVSGIGGGTGAAPTTGGVSSSGGAPTGGVAPLTGGTPPMSGGSGGTGGASGGASGGFGPTGGVATGSGGATGGQATGGSNTGGQSGGGASTGGQPTGGASTGGQASAVTYDCDIPPVGDGGQARPSGSTANLQVLDWAGFDSAISYTFDDSNSSQISHYEEMNSWGARYTFFLQTGKSESNDPVWQAALEAGHELGNHTQNHTCGGSDIDAGYSFIQQNFGVAPLTLAAPNGDDACANAGSQYFIIRSVAGGSIAPGDNTNPSWVPSNIPGQLGATAGRWQIYCIHGFTGGTDGAYQPISFDSFRSAVQQAQAGGAWVDTLANIGAYWIGQKALSSSGDNTWTWQLPEHFPPNQCLRVTVDGGTLSQDQGPIAWDEHGYYEISLDAGPLTWTPD